MASHSPQPAPSGLPTRRQLREAARATSTGTRAAGTTGVTDQVALSPVPDGRSAGGPVGRTAGGPAGRTAGGPVGRTAAGPAGRSAGGRVAAAERRRQHPLARWGTRAGVLVTLAAVTVAVPLSQQSALSADGFTDAEADATLPSTVEALTSSASSVLPPASLVSSDATALRAQLDVSRSEEREVLPGCDGEASTGAANGQLSQDDLCYLWDGTTQLRADAAEALAELNTMWVTRFGTDLCLSSGYRTLAEQRAVKAQKGGLAAPAGRSNHGWGLAVDVCSSQTTGVQWEWLNENAPVFGWENPAWARPGGSGPYERWHWEYTKGVMADGEYYG